MVMTVLLSFLVLAQQPLTTIENNILSGHFITSSDYQTLIKIKDKNPKACDLLLILHYTTGPKLSYDVLTKTYFYKFLKAVSKNKPILCSYPYNWWKRVKYVLNGIASRLHTDWFTWLSKKVGLYNTTYALLYGLTNHNLQVKNDIFNFIKAKVASLEAKLINNPNSFSDTDFMFIMYISRLAEHNPAFENVPLMIRKYYPRYKGHPICVYLDLISKSEPARDTLGISQKCYDNLESKECKEAVATLSSKYGLYDEFMNNCWDQPPNAKCRNIITQIINKYQSSKSISPEAEAYLFALRLAKISSGLALAKNISLKTWYYAKVKSILNNILKGKEILKNIDYIDWDLLSGAIFFASRYKRYNSGLEYLLSLGNKRKIYRAIYFGLKNPDPAIRLPLYKAMISFDNLKEYAIDGIDGIYKSTYNYIAEDVDGIYSACTWDGNIISGAPITYAKLLATQITQDYILSILPYDKNLFSRVKLEDILALSAGIKNFIWNTPWYKMPPTYIKYIKHGLRNKDQAVRHQAALWIAYNYLKHEKNLPTIFYKLVGTNLLVKDKLLLLEGKLKNPGLYQTVDVYYNPKDAFIKSTLFITSAALKGDEKVVWIAKLVKQHQLIPLTLKYISYDQFARLFDLSSSEIELLRKILGDDKLIKLMAAALDNPDHRVQDIASKHLAYLYALTSSKNKAEIKKYSKKNKTLKARLVVYYEKFDIASLTSVSR